MIFWPARVLFCCSIFMCANSAVFLYLLRRLSNSAACRRAPPARTCSAHALSSMRENKQASVNNNSSSCGGARTSSIGRLSTCAPA